MEALAEMLLSLFGSIFPVRFEFPLKNGVLEGVEAVPLLCSLLYRALPIHLPELLRLSASDLALCRV